MQEWLTVILVLLIAGVILDGIRRMRQSSKSKIKTPCHVEDFDDENVSVSASEFPTGGARVAGYRDEDDTDHLNDMFKRSVEETKQTLDTPEAMGTSVTTDIPTVDRTNEALDQEKSFGEFSPLEGAELEPQLGNLEDIVDFDNDGLSQPRARTRSDREPEPQVRSEPRVPTKLTKKQQPVSSEGKKDGNHEVIIIHVVANPGYVFSGDDLLKGITAEGMRFGDMDIFHRHENEDGSGSVMFSMVNMLKPGTFDLSNMETFETPGVSLFMNLPIEGDSLLAFRTMTKVAKGLVSELGGEMKDEFRSVMTPQTIEHCRQRVIEFDRRQRLEKA